MLKFSWKRFVATAHDIIMAGLSLLIALAARYGFDGLLMQDQAVLWITTFMGVSALVFQAVGLGRGMWRFASVTDLRRIVLAATIVVPAFLLVMFLINRLDAFPRSIPVVAWFVMVVLLGAPRLLYRAIKDGGLINLRPRDLAAGDREHVLIAGSAENADQLIRAYRLEQDTVIKVHGIVVSDSNSRGRHLRGIPVLGSVADIEAIVERLARNGVTIRAIVVTDFTEPEAFKPLLTAAAGLRLPLRRVVAEPITGSRPNLEAITVEDLLGRPAVNLELNMIRDMIAGRCVLITGAGGSIGSEVVRQVAGFGASRLLLFESSEYALYSIDQELARTFPQIPRRAIIGNVRDRARVYSVMHEEQPSLVFHAAALKHVPIVEDNLGEGVLTNVIGTRNVADAAADAGVDAVVVISTDKAVRPTSVMGATKRAAEAYCQALDVSGVRTRFITVRFGNVLGSAGSVVPLFKRQIMAGEPITVTHPDITRYFMTITEATQLVLQAAASGMAHDADRGRVFVLDMGKPVKIVDLARTMITLAGLRPDEDVKIEFTGLRPGEKLYEELFDAEETAARAGVEGVFVASPKLYDLTWIKAVVEKLSQAAETDSTGDMTSLLSSLVPEPQFLDGRVFAADSRAEAAAASAHRKISA